MKKRILSVALILVMGILALTGCGSSSSDKIVFGTNAEFPPFEFKSTNGVIDGYDGIDMAIAAKIGENAGKEVEIANMEFDSLLIALQNGQIDAAIAGMTITEERKESVDRLKNTAKGIWKKTVNGLKSIKTSRNGEYGGFTYSIIRNNEIKMSEAEWALFKNVADNDNTACYYS